MILRGPQPEFDPEKEGLLFIPDHVDFGEQGVEDMEDDPFTQELIRVLSEPIDPDAPVRGCCFSVVTAGGPAIRPEDEWGRI